MAFRLSDEMEEDPKPPVVPEVTGVLPARLSPGRVDHPCPFLYANGNSDEQVLCPPRN